MKAIDDFIEESAEGSVRITNMTAESAAREADRPNDIVSCASSASEEFTPLYDAIRENGDFHNPKFAKVEIQTERCRHRFVCLLSMQGRTNLQIAAETGYTPVHVSNILRQPWAQQYMSENLHLAGMDRVIMRLKGTAMKAAQQLEKEITNYDRESGGDAKSRISAAKAVIQQLYGSTTHVSVTTKKDPTTMSDAEISARIAELKATQAERS